MIRSFLFFILSLTVGLSSAVSHAEITVGGEFEFTRSNLPEINVIGLKGYEEDMAKDFIRTLKTRCAQLGCREKKAKGKWKFFESRFEFDAGFWIQVSWDPRVVEILTSPLTLSRAKELSPLLEDAIFETSRQAGLEVSPERAGHFNFGVMSAFEGDTDLFLRYVIDFENHPELASGVLRKLNLLTAPPLSALRPEQRNAMSDVARLNLDGISIQKLAQILMEDVFYKSHHDQMPFETAIHNQALGLKKVPEAKPGKDVPMEIRAARSQESFEEFLLIGELVQARIEFLKTLEPEKARFYNRSERFTFSDQELVDRFYLYVAETGLSWSKFRMLLPKEIRDKAVSRSTIRSLKSSAPRCERAFDLG